MSGLNDINGAPVSEPSDLMCFDVNDGAEVEVTHAARLETT